MPKTDRPVDTLRGRIPDADLAVVVRYLRHLADTATEPDSWVARIDPTPERFPWIARVLRALATEYEDVRALSARLGRD